MFYFWEKIFLEQVRRGNPRAFAKLYDQYGEKIYRFIYFKISDRDKAQDLTSEVFIKIFNYLVKEKKEIRYLRAFLYQTARNLVIDSYRASVKETLPIDEFAEESKEVEQEVEKDLDLKLNLNRLEDALKKIPDHYREVLVLRFIEELPVREVSKIIDQSEGNVRQLAFRGLKLLKKALKQE